MTCLNAHVTVQARAIQWSSLSSATDGGEGMFNLHLNGRGNAVLESDYPKEKLVEITLSNDVLK